MRKLIIILMFAFASCCPIGKHITNDPKSIVGYCMWCVPDSLLYVPDAGVSDTDAGPEPCYVGMENGTLFHCDLSKGPVYEDQ